MQPIMDPPRQSKEDLCEQLTSSNWLPQTPSLLKDSKSLTQMFEIYENGYEDSEVEMILKRERDHALIQELDPLSPDTLRTGWTDMEPVQALHRTRSENSAQENDLEHMLQQLSDGTPGYSNLLGVDGSNMDHDELARYYQNLGLSYHGDDDFVGASNLAGVSQSLESSYHESGSSGSHQNHGQQYTSNLDQSRTTTTSEFFRRVDDKLSFLDFKDSQPAEPVSWSNVDDLIERSRCRYTLVPQPECQPDGNKGLKSQRVPLLELFRVFGEVMKEGKNQFTTENMENSMGGDPALSKKVFDPFQYLSDCSVFMTNGDRISSVSKNCHAVPSTKFWTQQGMQGVQNKGLTVLAINYRHPILLFSTDLADVHEQNTLRPDANITVTKLGEKAYSLDISPDCSLYCVATEATSVHVRGTEGSWGKLTIKKIFAKGDEISKVRFVSNRDLLILVGDQLFWVKISKLATILSISTSHLLNPVASPEYIPSTFQIHDETFNGACKFSVNSIAQVAFYTTTNDREVLEDVFQRPCTALPQDYCKVEKYGNSGVYFVFWGKMLFILKRMDYSGNAGHLIGMPQLNDTLNSVRYELQESIETGFKADFITLFGDSGILMARRDGRIKISAIGCHSIILKKGSYYMPEDIQFRGIMGLTGDASHFLKNIENKFFKTSEGSIYFLDTSGVKQLKQTKVEQLIQEFVNEGEWHTAIKIAVQKYNRLEPSDQSTTTLENTIRIISTKYIDYFLQSTKVRPGQATSQTVNITSSDKDLLSLIPDSPSNLTNVDTRPSSSVATRLRLIFQMLVLSNNTDFLFETIRHMIQPFVFWRAIGDVVTRYGGVKMNSKYLAEEMITLPEAVVEVLVMNCLRNQERIETSKEKPTGFEKKHEPEKAQASLGFSVFGMISDLLSSNQNEPQITAEILPSNVKSILEEQEENFTRLVHALKRKGYWTCVFKLGLQFPETKVMSLFLTILLSNAFESVTINPEKAKYLLSRTYVASIIGTVNMCKQVFEQDDMLSTIVRLFYFLRQIVNLRIGCSQNTKEQIWSTFLEWMLNKHNLVTINCINFNLYLEVLYEMLLIPELVQSYKMLKHLHRILRTASGWVVVSPQSERKLNPDRIFDNEELKDYCKIVVKELLDYLYNVIAHEVSGSSISQDIGFLYSKIVKLKPFQDLINDAPVTISFIRYSLTQPYEQDKFYDKYSIICKDDFELAIFDLYEGVYRMKPKLVSNTVKQDLVEQAISSEM